MMMLKLLVASTLLVAVYGIVCTPNLCDSERCQKINSTQCTADGGIIRANSSACQCCDECIIQLSEGSTCKRLWHGQGIPTSECGQGLTCDGASRKCVKKFVCDPHFCDGGRFCPNIEPTRCKNSGGILKINASICLCCETCIQQLGKGEDCFVDLVPGSGQPTAECGQGLHCNGASGECVK